MRFHQFRTYSSPVEQLQVEKVEFSTLLESLWGPWGVLGGPGVVILGLEMSVLTRQIEWYACGTSRTHRKEARADFQIK